jgi:DNA-directed RNA polymerase subunit RPC12/RpoP
MDQDRFGPMDQEKYDGADYVCDNCGSEIMIKHTGDGEKHKSLNYTCRCGTEMRLEDARVAAR